MDGNTPVSLENVQFAGKTNGGAGLKLGRRMLRGDVLLIAFEALAVWDILVVVASGYVCAVLDGVSVGNGWLSGNPASFNSGHLPVAGALLAPLVLRSRGMRTAFYAFASNELLSATCQRLTLWVASVLSVGLLLNHGAALPAAWAVTWIAAVFVGVVAGRLAAVAVLRTASERGLLWDRVAVLGAGLPAERLLRHLRGARSSGVELAGVFNLSPADDEGFEQAIGELTEMGRRGEIDRVVLALPDMAEGRVFDTILRLKALDIEVSLCPTLIGVPGEGLQATQVAGAPLIVLANRPFDRGGRVFKSIFDRLAAVAAIVFLSPVLALAAIAVRLDSPGPVIFRQGRHGWNNTEFQVYKFRTMRWQAGPAGDGAVQTRRGDRRVTCVGAFLRKTSIDELPQLFNVLTGTMSLVGPRPHPVVMRTEDRLGEEIIAEYSHRHRVKPGITGWAQIHGHRGATQTAEQVRSRVEHDLYYIDNWSFLLDLRILVLTPFKIVFQRTNAF